MRSADVGPNDWPLLERLGRNSKLNYAERRVCLEAAAEIAKHTTALAKHKEQA